MKKLPDKLQLDIMWSEKNPIDWDEIEKNDNPDMLITKTGVEMMHYQCYLWECNREEETDDFT